MSIEIQVIEEVSEEDFIYLIRFRRKGTWKYFNKDVPYSHIKPCLNCDCSKHPFRQFIDFVFSSYDKNPCTRVDKSTATRFDDLYEVSDIVDFLTEHAKHLPPTKSYILFTKKI